MDLAVKCPRPEFFTTQAQRERFITEAQTWVSLGLHPNVCGCHYVRVLDADGIPRMFAGGITRVSGVWPGWCPAGHRPGDQT